MLKLKLRYFGHLMQTDDSLEKSLMLGRSEGRKIRGHQRMRWLGGITNATDAIEFLLAGASAIEVGTANFMDPAVTGKIVDGINDYLDRHGFASVRDIIGALEI